MITSLPSDKTAARKLAANHRLMAHEQFKGSAPSLLASQGFPAGLTEAFKVVSAFFPVRSEIDTRPLLTRLAGEGWTTCLPVVVAEGLPLLFRSWQPGDLMTAGAMKIDVPLATADEAEPDVLIVPLLAFDRKGYRLGYGGGFYDRTLTQLRAKKKIIAIGAAYAAQEVEQVPHADHDQPLDFVMTELGVRSCA